MVGLWLLKKGEAKKDSPLDVEKYELFSKVFLCPPKESNRLFHLQVKF